MESARISTLLNTLSPDGMTLEAANALIACVQEKAAQMGLKSVCAVADGGGNPVSVQSMDGAYLASWDVAASKAYTVVALKMSTIDLKPLAQPGGSLYGIQFTNQGRIVIFGGGVPLRGTDGSVLAGLGVSGGTEEQDTFLAAYGGTLYETCLSYIKQKGTSK